MVQDIGGVRIMEKALVVIDIQNDITKNYKKIIDNINQSIDWAVQNNVPVVYIKHFNLSSGTRTFKPDTRGSELVSDLNVISNNIFTKSKGNILTSEEFLDFMNKNKIAEVYITGADAIACVKSSVYNLTKAGYKVNILTDCITSYDKRKLSEMFDYYKSKGCELFLSSDLLGNINR